MNFHTFEHNHFQTGMLTFSRLGRWGNLGNQLFQIASVIGLAEKHGHGVVFPEWKFSEFLEGEFPSGTLPENLELLRESEFSFHEWPIQTDRQTDRQTNYDFIGWLQSEKYFDVAKTREQFRFRKSLVNTVLDKHRHLFDKPTILISVRRGDFVNNPNYFQLSYKYYLLALQHYFPD